MKTLKEYNNLQNLHNTFTIKVADLIEFLIRKNEIKYHLIEKRTKSQISIAEKIVRKNIDFDTNKEITDISGIRIITYYQKDVDEIEQIIKSQFEIDFDNSIDKSQILKNNEFGYQSIHYVVKMNSERSKLDEWISFKDLKVEVQIRTVLQHSWASISHELQYKKSYEIPDMLKRKLFRLASLFELADEEFEELREKHKRIEEKVFNQKGNEYQEIKNEINSITIDNFIRNSDIVKRIENLALESGFGTSTLTNEEIIKEFYKEQLSLIQQVLKEINIKTIDELSHTLNNSINKAKVYFTKVYDKALKRGISSWDGSKDFFLYLLLLSEKKDLSSLKDYWSKEDAKIIREAILETYK